MKGEDNMKKHRILKGSCALALAVLLLIPVLSMPAFADGLGLNTDTKPASQYTIDANEQVYALLDFDDERELENAERGLIVAPDSLVIKTDSGKVAWSQDAYAFLDEDAPDTANPSLWRNTQLNHIYGLFEVTDGIYQVRGYDMSNITFIKGETGWIVYDPLMTVECAQAAYELVKENIGDYPIKAVLYSHSHVDHYGGVAALITDEQALNGDVLVIAPEGFEEHAVSENVYAGNAMARRASYQYGTLLEPGVTGALCIGIGMGQSHGTTSYISPNVTITRTGETMVVDGVIMEFQLTPGTEAPAEMNTWFPQKNALWLAENCTGTLHNLYTLRGAEVRDGQAWAIRQGRRGGLPGAQLAALGQREHRGVYRQYGRGIQVYQRPDPAVPEPGLYQHRDRQHDRASGRAGKELVHQTVLRHGRPQCQGGLPEVHGLV